MSYNRALLRLDASAKDPSYLSSASLLNVWAAGALAGFATWIVSAPTELVKCRTQVGSEAQSSLKVVKDVWRREKVPGFYVGGGVTSIRDAVGYG
ncbi:hypothetical protein MMC20_007282, partial [Loxospora ochrophaea]|nr:hypothetical protein [Loxospora ochrophaea]